MTALKSKALDTLDSRNFFVSLITLFLLPLAGNGIEVAPDLADKTYYAIVNKNLLFAITVIFPNVVQPVIKLIRSKSWSWSFSSKLNFWTQVATVALMGLGLLGIVFPEFAADTVFDAIAGGNIGLIIAAFGINIINPLWHFFFDKRDNPKAITPQA